MSLSDVRKSISKFSQEFFKQDATITGIKSVENNWIVEIEVMVYDDYMREKAKRPLVETYQIDLDNSCGIKSFKRLRMREKGSIEELYEE
ncbi:MAG: hypothetical protein A2Y24_01705 [Clostridiales bacterium GWE2_32_10]|nr:MAG: hypothetical protein A2X02_04695 [Bacteroidetes bacterium GWF2_29_10]OGO87163.1 MAG: hypothetical protein A2Y24_01705 [Clostridiales bacterium GWE2_32_10]HBY19677.1 hypothetical protein [Clostridiales bacterium]